MSRFDDLRHRAWVRGRPEYGGDSFRGDARAEFLKEMLDGANYADQAARDGRRWWTRPATWVLRLHVGGSMRPCGGSWPARSAEITGPSQRRRPDDKREPGARPGKRRWRL